MTRPSSTVLTEVRIVALAYGFGKLAEAGQRRSLISPHIPEGVKIVPYLEQGVIHGVYIINREGAIKFDEKSTRYPVLDVVPYFLLDDDGRVEMQRDIKAANLNFKTPEEVDRTSDLIAALRKSDVLWRHAGAQGFSLENFLLRVTEIKASGDFKDIFLIKTKEGKRYVMAVNRLIESVIDLHPIFMRVYQPEAVRIAFQGNDNTWIAPFGSARAALA